MTDPLSLLRQYNVNKKIVIEHDNQCLFGELSWPKNVKTNYLIRMPGKKGGNIGSVKEYYTLECLLFFLKNINLTHPEYVRKAAAANILAVRRPDKKDLLAYLKGEIATCASIDRSAPLEKPTQVKHIHHNEEGISVKKKPRIKKKKHIQKVQEQLIAHLDVPNEASVRVDNIKKDNVSMSELDTKVEKNDDGDEYSLGIIKIESTNSKQIELESDTSSSAHCKELCKNQLDVEKHQIEIGDEVKVEPIKENQEPTKDNNNVSQFVETNKSDVTTTKICDDLQVESKMLATSNTQDGISESTIGDHNTTDVKEASDTGSSVHCKEELCENQLVVEKHQSEIGDDVKVEPIQENQEPTKDNYNVSQFVETNTSDVTITKICDDLQVESKMLRTSDTQDGISESNIEDHNTMDEIEESLENSDYEDNSNNSSGPHKISECKNLYGKDTLDSNDKSVEIDTTSKQVLHQNETNQVPQEVCDENNKTNKNTSSIDNQNVAEKTDNKTETNISCNAKRKLESIDAGTGKASKISKLQEEICDLLERTVNNDDDWIFVDNLKATFPRINVATKDYGLNPEFLDSLGLNLPLSNTIIVNGLSEKVNEDKLREVFSLAGEIRNLQIIDNKTAEIEYDHPVEAVQAISMFKNRKLYDKVMSVSMKFTEKILPAGLSSIGKGFGGYGEPLRYVSTVIEKTEIKEALCRMGRLKKTQDKSLNYPFCYRYKKKKGQIDNSNKVDKPNDSTDSTNVFRFTVPGTGESEEAPAKTPDSALKELNQILKERGVIPENIECKNVKEVLNVLKSKTNEIEKSIPQATKLQPNLQGNKTLNANNGSVNNDRPVSIPSLMGKKIKITEIPKPKPLPPNPTLLPTPMPPRIPNLQSQQNLGQNLRPNMPRKQPTSMNIPSQQNFHQNMCRNVRPHNPQNFDSRYGRGQGAGALIFRNMPPSISQQILTHKMLQVGDLNYCQVIGFGRAVVRFNNIQDSDRCLQIFNKSKVDGHVVDVFYENKYSM